MSEPTTAELRQMAREAFGRDLGAAEAEALRLRLPTMARLARLLREQARRLGETEPAAIHVTPARERGGG
jgi:hypothetical protein